MDLPRFYGDLATLCVASIVAAFFGQRVLYFWEDRGRRRASDLATMNDFYGAYGQFYTAMTLWNTYSKEESKGTPQYKVTWPHDVQWQLLERTEDAEGVLEGTLIKLASERKLDKSDQLLLRSFRQGYQSLRESIRDGNPLLWWQSDFPGHESGYREYQVFKALSAHVAHRIATPSHGGWTSLRAFLRGSGDQGTTYVDSVAALTCITSRDDEWCATAAREFALPMGQPCPDR